MSIPSEDSRLLYSFRKRLGEEVQFNLKKYQEKYFIDIRVWFEDKSANMLKPTKKGLFLQMEHVSELKKAIERTAKAVEGMPNASLDPGH